MIIIEGTDLLGKTTLCRELVKRLASEGYIYAHLTRLPPGWDYYWDYVARMSRRVVQDRFHDSELAYSHARGEGETGTLLWGVRYDLVDARFRLLGGMKFVVTATQEVLSRRYEAHGDDMYKIDVISRANEWFFENTNRFDYHHHITEVDEYPSQTELVDKFVREYLDRQSTLDFVLNSRRRLDGTL